MSHDYKIMGVWLKDTVLLLFCMYEALGSMSNTTKQTERGRKGRRKGKKKRIKPGNSCKARHVPVISALERLKQAEKDKVSLGCTVHPSQPEL